MSSVLSAVVCPLTEREVPRALANLETWERQTPPTLEGFAPGGAAPDLIYSFNGAPDVELSRLFGLSLDNLPLVRSSFAKVDVRFCALPPAKDLYVRDGETRYAPFGRKAGPNWLFYETLRGLRDRPGFVFLMETDCEPITTNWLRRLQRVCSQHDDAWIVGSHYCGVSPLHWSVARHVNGNALYNVGDPAFWRFLDDDFWPWLNDYIAKEAPNLAYDCGWETYLNRMEMEHAGNYDWIKVRDVLQRFRLSSFIVNIGGAAEQAGDYIWTRADILRRFPNAALVHGPLATGLTHRRGAMALGRPRLEGEIETRGEALLVRGAPGAARFARSAWLVNAPLESGDEIAVHYLVAGPVEAGVAVTLADPNGRVIASKRRYGASPGERRAGRCIATLQRTLPYVTIAFDFSGPDDATVTLTDIRIRISRGEERLGMTNRVLEE